MGEFIQSNNCLFQIDRGNGYESILCAKSFSVTLNTKEKETTSIEDGFYQDFDYDSLSYTMNLNSALKIESESEPVVFDFAYYQQNFIEIPFRIIFEADNGDVKVFRGICIVKTCNLSSSASQLADGTVDLIGKGRYYLEDHLPNPVNLRLYSTDGTGGNSIGRFKFKLIDEEGNTVFTTETLDQAVNSYLENPFDITTQIESGNYFYWWQAITETDNNVFTYFGPVNHVHAFATGTQEENTYPDTMYDFTENREVSWSMGPDTPNPNCVPVEIIGNPHLPDATELVAYSYTFVISGTAPFILSNITKPSWMNISTGFHISGNTAVNFEGTPDAPGTGIEVSFDITNCSGGGSVNFSDTINVEPNADAILIDWSFVENAGSSGTFRIYRNGIQIVFATSTANGQTSCNPGDLIQAIISTSGTTQSVLEVEDSISGTLHSHTGTGTDTYFWNAVSGHDYNVGALTQL